MFMAVARLVDAFADASGELRRAANRRTSRQQADQRRLGRRPLLRRRPRPGRRRRHRSHRRRRRPAAAAAAARAAAMTGGVTPHATPPPYSLTSRGAAENRPKISLKPKKLRHRLGTISISPRRKWVCPARRVQAWMRPARPTRRRRQTRRRAAVGASTSLPTSEPGGRLGRTKKTATNLLHRPRASRAPAERSVDSSSAATASMGHSPDPRRPAAAPGDSPCGPW